MFLIAYILGVIVLIIVLIALALIQALGEHYDQVEQRRRHGRPIV